MADRDLGRKASSLFSKHPENPILTATELA